MSRNVQTEIVNDIMGNIDIEYEHNFVLDRWTEECHGYHQFEDATTVSVKVLKVILRYNDLEIDITDRLKKDEIKDIEYELMP
jgi:hypothetical protein